VHRVITVIGVVLLVLGLVFTFVPLFNGPSKDLTPSQPVAAFDANTSVALTPDWTIGVGWTSNQQVSILIVVCHTINLSASSEKTVCPGAALHVLNGTSGSGTYSVPIGGTLLVGIASNTTPGLRVDVQLKPTLTVIGTILVVGGIGVMVVGLVPRRKPRPPSATPQAAPPSGDGP
jgi:hypothetical protein